MPSRTPSSFYTALPGYLGGKRRLAPLIFAALADTLPRDQWAEKRFLDPFCGGGAVALTAKAQGFHVVAADLALRGAVVAQALIANSHTRLTRATVLELLRRGAEGDGSAIGMGVRRALTPEQAAWFGGVMGYVGEQPEPQRSLLTLLVTKVFMRSFPMSLPSATDAPAAARGDYDRISPRRVGEYLKARALFHPERMLALAEGINAGVIGGGGEGLQGDAREVISGTEADVLYLDPPYPGTTGYHGTYRLLDELLGDTQEAGAPPALEELLGLSAHIPLLVLSYGGPKVTLDGLRDQVGHYRRVLSSIEIPYPRLRTIAKEDTNAKSKEFIVIAER